MCILNWGKCWNFSLEKLHEPCGKTFSVAYPISSLTIFLVKPVSGLSNKYLAACGNHETEKDIYYRALGKILLFWQKGTVTNSVGSTTFLSPWMWTYLKQPMSLKQSIRNWQGKERNAGPDVISY